MIEKDKEKIADSDFILDLMTAGIFDYNRDTALVLIDYIEVFLGLQTRILELEKKVHRLENQCGISEDASESDSKVNEDLKILKVIIKDVLPSCQDKELSGIFNFMLVHLDTSKEAHKLITKAYIDWSGIKFHKRGIN